MAKLANFSNRSDLKAINNDINEALKAVGEKYGITMKCGNGSYDANKYSVKVECQIKGVDININTFNTYCKLYGLEETDYKRIFQYKTKKYQIVGIKPRTKYPISCIRLDNNAFVSFTQDCVLNSL